jgi:phospholipid transport system substrate-binding protein
MFHARSPRFLVLGALLLLTPAFGRPAAAVTPAEFVARLGDDAVQVLGSRDINDQQKIDKFRVLLNGGFDLPLIGRLVLGFNWRTANDEQRKEYSALFEQFIVDSYAQRLGRYGGETLKVRAARADGNDTLVTSEILQPGGPPVKVEWRVRGREPDYRVVDVIVENISMVITQRDEFAAVVQRCGGKLDCLLERLRDKTLVAGKR